MKKLVWTNDDVSILKNTDIDCYNCVFALRNITAFCGKYPDHKPKNVFEGYKCPSKKVNNG